MISYIDTRDGRNYYDDGEGELLADLQVCP